MTTRRNLFGLLAGAGVAPYIPAATAAPLAMTYDWKPYSVGFIVTKDVIAVNEPVYRAFVAELNPLTRTDIDSAATYDFRKFI